MQAFENDKPVLLRGNRKVFRCFVIQILFSYNTFMIEGELYIYHNKDCKSNSLACKWFLSIFAPGCLHQTYIVDWTYLSKTNYNLTAEHNFLNVTIKQLVWKKEFAC